MKFTAETGIMPRPELPDSQGKAAMLGLEHPGLVQVGDVGIGRPIRLELETGNEQAAQDKADQACRKLLANLIMESCSFRLIRDLERHNNLPGLQFRNNRVNPHPVNLVSA